MFLRYKLNTSPTETTTELSVNNGTISTATTLWLSDDYSKLSGHTEGDIIGLGSKQDVIIARDSRTAGAELLYNNSTHEFVLSLHNPDIPIQVNDVTIAKSTRYLIYDTETKVPIVDRSSTDFDVTMPTGITHYVNMDNNIISLEIKYDSDGNDYAVIDDVPYPIVQQTDGSYNGGVLKIYTNDRRYLLGDSIRITSSELFNRRYIVEPGQQFIHIMDSWYQIEANMAYECIIDGDVFSLVQDSTNPHKFTSRENPAFIFTENAGILSYLTVSGNTTIVETTPLLSFSGVTYDNRNYIIRPEIVGLADGTTETMLVATVPTNLLTHAKIIDAEEPNCYTLGPDSLEDDVMYNFLMIGFSDVCSYIAQNPSKVFFSYHNTMLGESRLDYSVNLQGVMDNLVILVPSTGFEIPLTFSNDNPLNLYQEYRLNNDYPTKVEDDLLSLPRNRIKDMDYDMYVPGYLKSLNAYKKDVPSGFLDVNEIRFNLHFRTRDLETGQVIEDDKNPYTHTKCNWFVTDYYNPLKLTKKSPAPQTDYTALCRDLVKDGDLLGFIGFSDDDVRYRKDRLAKSFIRLSFYDTNDYTKQSLLYHTTIFVNENECYGKYVANNNSGNLFLPIEQKLEGSVDVNACDLDLGFETYFGLDENTICRFTAIGQNDYTFRTFFKNFANDIMIHANPGDIVAIGVDDNTMGYYEILEFVQPMKLALPTSCQYKARLLCAGRSHSQYHNLNSPQYAPIKVVKYPQGTAGVMTEQINQCFLSNGSYVIPSTLKMDENRLSTQIKTYKNTEKEKCSDGFYIHLFKEYATRYHKRTIYMKVEFNNAATGKVSQFMMLQNQYGHMITSYDEITDTIKEGYDVREMHKHVFIPIQVIYDSVAQRYTYYFENNYSDIMNFNLFEVKYRYSTNVPGTYHNKSMTEITVRPNDYDLGNCTGSGFYLSGNTVTITAEPASGKACWQGWNDLPDTDPDKYATARTITVTENDTTYTANFEEYYRVHIHTNDSMSGDTLIKTGDIALDINISDGTPTGRKILTGATTAITYDATDAYVVIDRADEYDKRHLVPTYEYLTGVTTTTFYMCPYTDQQPAHTLTYTHGTETIHCIQCYDGYLYVRGGDKLRITPTPHLTYKLDHITLNGVTVSKAAGVSYYEIEITKDSDVTVFNSIQQCNVTVNTNDTSAGLGFAYTGSTPVQMVNLNVDTYTTVHFSAETYSTSAMVYFDHWEVNGQYHTSSVTFDLIVSDNTAVTAIFHIAYTRVNFSFLNPFGMPVFLQDVFIDDGDDTFSSSSAVKYKEYINGTNQTFTAIGNNTLDFSGWTINIGTLTPLQVSGNPLTIAVTGIQPWNLTAHYKTATQLLTIRSNIGGTVEVTTNTRVYNDPNGEVIARGTQIIQAVLRNAPASVTMPLWSDGFIGFTHPGFTLDADTTITID